MTPRSHLLVSSAVVLTGMLFPASSVQAVVLAQYGFNTAGNPDSADTTASGLTATAATSVAGGDSGLFPIEGARSQYIFNADLTNTPTPTVSEIIMSFSLTPDAGQVITLDATDSVTWEFLSYDNDAGSMHTYTRLYVASDAAFTNILASSATFDSDHESTLGGGNPSDSRWGPIISANLDNAVSSSGTLYFGLAAGDNSTFGDKQLRWDNFTVNGTVAPVPEPSVALLAGLSLLGLLRRRR